MLNELLCDSNRLTSLDVSNNTALTYLNCIENPMTTLYLKVGQKIANLQKPDETVIEYISGDVSGSLNTEPVIVTPDHSW